MLVMNDVGPIVMGNDTTGTEGAHLIPAFALAGTTVGGYC